MIPKSKYEGTAYAEAHLSRAVCRYPNSTNGQCMHNQEEFLTSEEARGWGHGPALPSTRREFPLDMFDDMFVSPIPDLLQPG
jgi:hypothetical protein